MRSEIERVLTHLGVVTKEELERIVETYLTKWTSTLDWKIVKTVQFAFEDSLQASYSNPNNGLKTSMFHVVQQALGEVDLSGRAPRVLEAPMRDFIQTISVADMIVQVVLFDEGFTVPIKEKIGRLVSRAFDECRL